MTSKSLITINAALVLLALLLMLSGLGGGWGGAIAGFVFVVGGTFLASVSSQSADKVLGVLLKAPQAFDNAEQRRYRRRTLDSFLPVAEWARRGNARAAERLARQINDDFLRRGVMLVLDRTPEREMMRTLQWRIGNERENDQQEIRVIRAMVGYAPALGMLGTLLGLVQMLFGLGDKGINEIGVAMGFAMLTTVYGLIGANLLLKPLAAKMEQQSRARISWMYAQLEAVLMLRERSHPVHIQEALETYLDGSRDYPLPNLQDMAPRIRRLIQRTKAA
ncbi:MAG: MotA/TolQ/ExbB proton channel family protein [Gammaproteobacteria bacterium SHHR-1]|uniref:motility protein A n=1 Tax=Magnetovirga frankeli TaxID=947516 RepID=UPI001293FE5C|nr:MotA/TolQ/ExbB proton channel family protein [gamma proteobacterium SS-5]